ncbi:hypothetical protein QBC42DRAFT_297427 [Cladorrhinum samala]|uniref:Secreted protein n=1 Tax=Cladorrhinum samala TaxID=585594 RepID=A0AAV9HMB1_9PEZI|nr:hypothetical protein QBC42DRAFT_297427 [Cladorrhinum samala]
MVNLTNLLATVLASTTVVSAEYLAVIEHQMQSWNGGRNAFCQNTAPLFKIESFTSHPGPVGSGCSWKGKHVATSNKKNGSQMEGCKGGYTGGWSVCITSYGANVHNGKGQHQRCNKDDTQLLACPTPICWNTSTRKLKCQGVWHKDA